MLLLLLLRLAPVGPASGDTGEGECFGYIMRFDFRSVIGKIKQVNLFSDSDESVFDIDKKVMESFSVHIVNGGVTEFRFHFADQPISVVGVAVPGTPGNPPQSFLGGTD